MNGFINFFCGDPLGTHEGHIEDMAGYAFIILKSYFGSYYVILEKYWEKNYKKRRNTSIYNVLFFKILADLSLSNPPLSAIGPTFQRSINLWRALTTFGNLRRGIFDFT